ncbi:MAG: hypothetical protein E7Z90_05430 [Cyanobacteria bacterium SIG29]|nr:hypothetical protein [Cyanobacteria bacterium SIG29]
MNILNHYLQTRVVPPVVNRPVNQPANNHHTPNSTTKLSVWYSNDIHGQLPKMSRLVSAAQQAQVNANATGSDLLKLSAGDTCIGSDPDRNAIASQFLNLAGIDAHALGNHEFDITADICGKLLKDSKTKILGMNLNFPNQNSDLAKKVVRSTVVETKSGEKYGLIGIQPTDLVSRIKKKENLSGITVDDEKQTIKELQEEVNNLHKQGLNKVILLSHSGKAYEQEVAQKVSGIDVIIGGHSHHLIEGVKQGENLFYSPTGEPVIITQAGRDGNNFGVLNLEFNDKGQVVYAQNNVEETNNYSPNMIMSKTIDAQLGVSPEIGNLSYVDPLPKNVNIEENPWADFVADACRNQLDADIALINSANFRGSVGLGKVTERDISSIFPFCNKLFKVKLNEEDLVDAIKHCAKTMTNKNHKPGIMQVSGLNYTIDKNGNLLELFYHDKQGNKRYIDVNDPDDDKYYTAVYDEYLINGGDDMEMLKRDDDEIIQRYDFDKDKVTIDYIKTLAQPFEVRKDNRITILQ